MINHSNSPSRARLFGSAATFAIAATLAAAPAFAQTKTAAAAASEDEGTIVVTGSLISNPNLTRAAPVNVTTSEELNLRQTNVAEELLRDLPGAVPSVGSAVNNGNGGSSFVDLRGLGSFRNIVLLDGNRIVPSGLLGRVDLNNIPLALVDRVEVLTGGASTTYGADAISGVVNFVTKQNFSGIELSVGDQLTEKGDGNFLRTDLTIGGNFADGKGNAVLSIGYQDSDPVYQGDRDVSAVQFNSQSGGISGSSTAVPALFSFAGGGRPVGDPLRITGNQQLNPSSTAVTPGLGNYAPFNFNPYNVFQTPFQRYNIYAAAKYEVNDNLEFYTRGLFSKNTVETIIAPSGVFASLVTIPLSNPYLPSALATQFCNNQVFTSGAGVSSNTLTAAQCAAGRTAISPTDPNYQTFQTSLRRRAVETGPRLSDFVTTIFDYKAGFRGAISDSIRYDVSGAYGESETRQTLGGYVLTSRVRDGLLATNTATCISGNATCIPINVFGPAGSLTTAMANSITAASTTTVKTSLAQVHGTISGDFGYAIPSAKDPISFAVGGEYRRYTAQQQADLLAQTPGELGGAGGAAPNIQGGYDVYEAFGELIAPLVQDKPGFETLQISGGIRYSSYKVNAASSPKYKTTTYKGEGIWEPIHGFKLRGGYSHSVRAPNISELFTPVTVGLTNLANDPCAGAAPNANANLKAVCLAQGAPAGQIGSIAQPAAGQANISTGGNLNVKPEKSDSYTIGGVIQPTFFSGFSLSVDYYHIKVKDAITVPTPGDLVSACFGPAPYAVSAAAASSTACTVIRRNPTTGALDGDPATTLGLFGGLSNQGQLLTDGIDIIANYRRDIGFAKLALSFNGNYTFRSKFKSNQFDPASLDRECAGYYSPNCGFAIGQIQPEYSWSQRTTLSFADFDVSVLWRHLAPASQEPDDAVNGNGPAYSGPTPSAARLGIAAGSYGNYNFGKIKAYDYFDFTGRVSVMTNLDLTFTVQNLFNRQPPQVGNTVGTTSANSGNTYPSSYDALGRRYGIGARLKF